MYIYKLTKNKIPFYIGKTGDLKSRFLDHKKTYGNDIKIKSIASCDYLDSIDLESYYIKLYLKKGYNLLNKYINTTTKYKQKKLDKYLDKRKIKKHTLDIKYIKKIKHGDLTKISNINNISMHYIWSAYLGKKTYKEIIDCFESYLE